MIDKQGIDCKKAVELILLYENMSEYSNDYIVSLCKAALENEESEGK